MGAREDAIQQRIEAAAYVDTYWKDFYETSYQKEYRIESESLMCMIEDELKRVSDIVNQPKFDWSHGVNVTLPVPKPRWWNKQHCVYEKFALLTLGMLQAWKAGEDWGFNYPQINLTMRSDGQLIILWKEKVVPDHNSCETFQEWTGYVAGKKYDKSQGHTIRRLEGILKILKDYKAPVAS